MMRANLNLLRKVLKNKSVVGGKKKYNVISSTFSGREILRKAEIRRMKQITFRRAVIRRRVRRYKLLLRKKAAEQQGFQFAETSLNGDVIGIEEPQLLSTPKEILAYFPQSGISGYETDFNLAKAVLIAVPESLTGEETDLCKLACEACGFHLVIDMDNYESADNEDTDSEADNEDTDSEAEYYASP